MLRDQRNNGASGTAQGYTVDQWYYATTQVGKLTWQRLVAQPVLQSLGFGNQLAITTTTAFTAAAGDNFAILQPIEGDMI